MKSQFKQLPMAIQKQVAFRAVASILFLLAAILIFVLYKDLYFLIPCYAFSAFFGINSSLLFIRAIEGRYLVVEGVCSVIERTALRRKIKTIYFQSEPYTVKVMIQQRVKHIEVGDTIQVYVADNAPVYDQEHCKLICSYLAIENIRRVTNNKN